jgi:hypothetical protein
MERSIVFAKAAIAVAAIGLLSGGQMRIGRMTHLRARRQGPMRVHQRRDDASWDSYNWAGYAVTPANQQATDVKGTWVVPSVNCSTTPTGFSAYWVGIDGFNSSSVEQIGTDSDCESFSGKTGTANYYPWFELYPNPSYVIEFPSGVKPGDIITAEVKASDETVSRGRTVGTTFTMTITDVTQNEQYTTSGTVSGAAQSSAEWIVEAPEICSSGARGRTTCSSSALADFGSAAFSNGSATFSANTATPAATTNLIGGWGSNVQEITMVSESDSQENKAAPSVVSGGSFIATWYNPGP